ncbi:hypothetical protein HW114_12695 [Serratia symbiotica]|nr:hypothetical protein [Serratia symbiotica]MBF1996278.1 hypothetical protein [Serratia symbiotica]MBQ0955878.1 hypothetical protein [Serratia symbiotica]QTP15107.1 hypothetical protein GPZ83_0003790 [Serratia symbiotica]CDS55800.1 conserved hypothetical protein [Serratia symbiotica]
MVSSTSSDPSLSLQTASSKTESESGPPLPLADNIASCMNTAEPLGFYDCQGTENEINVRWSSHLSNDGMLDFIWCPHVNLSRFSCSSSDSEYFPESGSSAVFMHSNGRDLIIKNKKISPESFSDYITRLDGYNDSDNSSPLILAACKAGSDDADGSIAQKLANAIGRTIVASPGMIRAEANDEKTHIIKICSDQPFLAFTPSNIV